MSSMQLVDLTRKLDPNDLDLLPERLRRFSSNIVPEVHHVRPADEGAEVMCRIFGCTRDDLPDGEGWGDERLTITTHLGTHVDALRDVAERAGGIPHGGGALVRTGQERYSLADPEFFDYPGMTRDGTLLLADLGARVLGTDAVGWDRPFGVMRAAFEETGDAGQIWDGHFAGRDREVFIVQQLADLGSLPAGPVTVGFFPMYLAGCSAAPARVVAMVADTSA